MLTPVYENEGLFAKHIQLSLRSKLFLSKAMPMDQYFKNMPKDRRHSKKAGLRAVGDFPSIRNDIIEMWNCRV